MIIDHERAFVQIVMGAYRHYMALVTYEQKSFTVKNQPDGTTAFHLNKKRPIKSNLLKNLKRAAGTRTCVTHARKSTAPVHTVLWVQIIAGTQIKMVDPRRDNWVLKS